MINSNIPGAQIPRVLIPQKGIDLQKWAVIACDQFTSQPDYWQRVRNFVGQAPSTYHMILPEGYIGTNEEEAHIQGIKVSMRNALDEHLLIPEDGLIYVERILGQKTRKGLMLALDLEEYDFHEGAQTLIRASEGTILERIPPRVRIRENSPLEIPHIIVLIDDPVRTVIEPLAYIKSNFSKLYDFDLMADSGHLTGYRVNDPKWINSVSQAFSTLANPENFQVKYSLKSEKKPLLFAVGDGNHSLATAKTIWEKIKSTVGVNHPARFALVEVENIYDESLEFRPIHRVLFGLKIDPLLTMKEYFNQHMIYDSCIDFAEMAFLVDHNLSQNQRIGVISPKGTGIIEISNPSSHLSVGTLQVFLDDFLKKKGADRIDYIHGEEVISRLGHQPDNMAFYLPTMKKEDLFKTILLNGVLPRKAFSMGEACEKRFYMECRQIC